MTAVKLSTLLKKANKNNYAVAGLVVLGWEDALAFTQAADETGIPIILQAGPSCRAYTPVPILGKMFRYLSDQTKTPICCHIDHGYSLNECKEGMDSGFTSVMYDGSKSSLKSNINNTSKIAKLAKKSLPSTVPFDIAKETMSPMALSFWKENRKVDNKLLCKELGYSLLYPNFKSGLKDCFSKLKLN